MPTKSLDKPLFSTPNLIAHYDRDLKRLKQYSHPSIPVAANVEDVLFAHYLICDFFIQEGENIGGIGVKDDNMLISAVNRQFTSWGQKDKYNDPLEKISALFFGLIKNHAFHDANKRTAFIVALWQLESIKLTPDQKAKDFEDFSVHIADNKYLDSRRYQNLFKKETESPEVQYIKYYLKRFCRNIDRRSYEITYRDLEKILDNFGFEFRNHSKNYIDIYQKDKPRSFLGFPRNVRGNKMINVVCPGMGRRVPRNTINEIRKACHLDDQRGIDSAVFFQNVPHVSLLIGKYNEPLRRLADR